MPKKIMWHAADLRYVVLVLFSGRRYDGQLARSEKGTDYSATDSDTSSDST